MDKKQPVPKAPVRGLRVRTANLLMLLLSCLMYIVLLLATFQAARDYQSMVAATDLYILCQEKAAWVGEGSDYLTDQVRTFTVNPDPVYAESFFAEAHTSRRRDRALEQLNGQASPQAQGYLELALEHSEQLMGREIYAMRLAAEGAGMDIDALPEEIRAVQLSEIHQQLSLIGKSEQARELVFGQEYQTKKQLISDNIDLFLSDVMSSTQKGQQHSLDSLERSMQLERVLFSALFLMNLFIFAMISYLIVKPLQVYIKCIREEKRMEITGAYEFRYLALTYNDIYEINEANQILLRHQAEHDALTGLMNRDAFEQFKEVLRIKSQPMAVLRADVDQFKEIHGRFGRETGDLVLQKVAQLLKERFRSTDFSVRIGDDEFAVILADIESTQQARIEQKLRALNETLRNPTDGLPSVSLSIGGAFSPSGYTDNLYRQAEKALSQAKEKGRGGMAFAPQLGAQQL